VWPSRATSGADKSVRRPLRAAAELIATVAAALFCAFAAQAYAVKPYRIPSLSMEPTLHVGDRLLVNRFSYRVLGEHAQIGDVVVFHPPGGADMPSPVCRAPEQGPGTQTPCSRPTRQRSAQTFIKRVVAVGGDTIAIRGGHVILNGRLQREPFAAACGPGGACDFPTAITVPPRYVFLMGDNRGNSDDSRFWGPVPDSWVIGKAFATYWPPTASARNDVGQHCPDLLSAHRLPNAGIRSVTFASMTAAFTPMCRRAGCPGAARGANRWQSPGRSGPVEADAMDDFAGRPIPGRVVAEAVSGVLPALPAGLRAGR
jgi:signal peptidase I